MQTFGVHTSAMEEKSYGLKMIALYARDLHEAFADYVERALELTLPSLNYLLYNGPPYNALQHFTTLLLIPWAPILRQLIIWTNPHISSTYTPLSPMST